jgi:hypothetical protein
MLVLLPMMALLGGCIEMPVAEKRAPVKRSTAVVTPRPETRQCLASLGSSRANYTPVPTVEQPPPKYWSGTGV